MKKTSLDKFPRCPYHQGSAFEKGSGVLYRDLTRGNITKTILLFVLPMIAGNLLQQCYNIADTLIVGQFLGSQRPWRRWARPTR